MCMYEQVCYQYFCLKIVNPSRCTVPRIIIKGKSGGEWRVIHVGYALAWFPHHQRHCHHRHHHHANTWLDWEYLVFVAFCTRHRLINKKISSTSLDVLVFRQWTSSSPLSSSLDVLVFPFSEQRNLFLGEKACRITVCNGTLILSPSLFWFPSIFLFF